MFGLNIEQHRQKALVSKPCFFLRTMATDLVRQQDLWDKLIHCSNVFTSLPENRNFCLFDYS